MSKKNHKNKNPRTKNKFVYIIPVLIIIAALTNLIFNSNKSNPIQIKKNNMNSYTSFNFKKQGELTFISQAGEEKNVINIEIADNDEKRQNGLMYRNKMKENNGMLFIFPYETIQSFWMRNTIIYLDMIFVNKDMEIVTIRKNAIPFKDNVSYTSTEPAMYVVEVVGGYTDKFDIQEGDKIVWRRL